MRVNVLSKQCNQGVNDISCWRRWLDKLCCRAGSESDFLPCCIFGPLSLRNKGNCDSSDWSKFYRLENFWPRWNFPRASSDVFHSHRLTGFLVSVPSNKFELCGFCMFLSPLSSKDMKDSSVIEFKQWLKGLCGNCLHRDWNSTYTETQDQFKSSVCDSGEEVRKGTSSPAPLLHFVWRFLPISSFNLLSDWDLLPVAAFPIYSPMCKTWCAHMHGP